MKINEDGTAEFEINISGDKSNDTYMGNFTTKCLLTPMETLRVGRKYRELLGTNLVMATELEKNIAFALAELEQRLIKFPPFWMNNQLNGSHIKDLNVIQDILEKSLECQDAYEAQKNEEAEAIQRRLTEGIKKNFIKKEDEDATEEREIDDTPTVDLDE